MHVPRVYPSPSSLRVAAVRQVSRRQKRGERKLQPLPRTLLLRDTASIQSWRRQLWTTIPPHSLPVVRFDLPQFSDSRNLNLSVRAEDYRKVCGCMLGGLLMGVTVVTLSASYFLSGGRLVDVTFEDAASFAGAIVLAVLCGKVIGMSWARWRLLWLAAQIHHIVVRTT